MQDMPENHEKERGRETESVRGRGREEAAHLNVLHVHVAGAVGGVLALSRGGGEVKYRNNGFASARKMLNENFLTTCHGRQAGAAGGAKRKEGRGSAGGA